MATVSSPGPAPSGWDTVPAILARIIPPIIPERVVTITDHGAVSGGVSDCRTAIVAAISACAQAGGGRVLVPAGTWLCNGPLQLVSGIDLHLAAHSVIRFGTDPDDYLVGDPAVGGGVLMGWEGTPIYNYSPLVYAFRQHGIAITGTGTLDGQAEHGWCAWKQRQETAQLSTRAMNHAQVPIRRRIFGRGHFLRPTFIEPYECTDILIEGVTVKGSPFWTIHPNRCSNVTVRNVTIEPGTTNDDGIDPDACTDVLIEDCRLTTADDNIALKAGRDQDGWAVHGGLPCQNIVIRRCTFARGAPGGISLGSEMSGDIRNVFVEDCTMVDAERPFYLKSNPERGGVIAGFWARDIVVARCTTLLTCEMDYKQVASGAHLPRFQELYLERMTCASAAAVFVLQGLADSPISGVTLSAITVASASNVSTIRHVDDVRITDVTVNGQDLTTG